MFRTFFAVALIGGLLAVPAMAQDDYEMDSNLYGPEAGDWELTLGGDGSFDQDISGTNFGFNGSVGYFFDEAWEVAVRQGLNYTDVSTDSNLNGSTRVALDYHFDMDRWRPFVGVNFGGAYGDGVVDTFAAGLEGGVKYYVKPKTFLYGLLEYQWLFDNDDTIDEAFDDGQFIYNLGIGFNF